MAGTLPLGHVRANLADHLQGRIGVHAVDPGQVHSRHPKQVRSNVEGRCVPLIALFAIVSRRPTVAAVLKPLRLGFNLPVARGFAQPMLRETFIAQRMFEWIRQAVGRR